MGRGSEDPCVDCLWKCDFPGSEPTPRERSGEERGLEQAVRFDVCIMLGLTLLCFLGYEIG